MACLVTYLADPRKREDLIVNGRRISFKGGVPIEVDDLVGTAIMQMARKHLYKVEFIQPVPEVNQISYLPEPAPIFKKTKTAKKIKQGKIA